MPVYKAIFSSEKLLEDFHLEEIREEIEKSLFANYNIFLKDVIVQLITVGEVDKNKWLKL